MQEFTGKQYLQIDIANTFGMDKLIWRERLDWFRDNETRLWDLVPEADNPILYQKAIHAWEETLKGNPVGHIMFLDVTASGLQIMAAVSGCLQTAEAVNMIDPSTRRDVYQTVVDQMNKLLAVEGLSCLLSRSDVKKPIMTHYYNKIKQLTLNEVQQKVFYKVLAENFTGAETTKAVLNQCWDSEALDHSWTLPDGHVAFVPVTETDNFTIEVDELDHATFTYRTEHVTTSKRSSSLCPNVIHSLDAWVCREMIRRCNRVGIELVTIHDAFGAHPNNMNFVRNTYREVMAELAASNTMENILFELGFDQPVSKYSDKLPGYILQSEYMLS